MTGRVGVVAAMHEELGALLAQMSGESAVMRGGRRFWIGRLEGREIVAVLSGIGKVAAAATAALLCAEFAVERALLTGTAGGLAEGVSVGDVVVAEALLQHDMDASPLFPRHEVPLYGTDRFVADAAMSAAVEQAARRALPDATVHRGLVVSGDRFVATVAESAVLRERLPAALAVEMEGAALAQVCHDFGVPFAVVRTISDRADDAAHVDFGRFVEAVASRHTLAIVSRYLAAA